MHLSSLYCYSGFEKVSVISSYTFAIWFNILSDGDVLSSTENNLLNVIRFSPLDLSDDLVIAVNMLRARPKQVVLNCQRKRTKLALLDDINTKPVEFLLPFVKSQHSNVTVTAPRMEQFCKYENDARDTVYCILQTYKIRRTSNTSLAVAPLGFWTLENGTENLRSFLPVERRLDFHGFPLILGKKKYTQDATVANENIIEENNDPDNMEKIADYIRSFLNAKERDITYVSLGLKGTNDEWSDLLGAVVKQEVDLGLDTVIKTPERYEDMSFSHNVMLSIRNIYLKPEESHSARDIFLVPFGKKLLLSLVATIIIIAIVMAIYLRSLQRTNSSKNVLGQRCFSDSAVWCLAVFSMQGSLIKPKTYSGNVIVVTSLLLALIVYNSYQAFITSVLSIKLTSIRTVSDLLDSDYDIGYTKNSQDEIFLRSMNNVSQLKEIYLRGYLHNNIKNITEGLIKATNGNYGFFATNHLARKQLLKISSYKCKYEIMEIPIASTMKSVAFPMAKHSPYNKLINLCLIKMYESGIHDYIITLIAPGLPACNKPRTYQSARINDLTTAFAILGLGVMLSMGILIAERLWKNKNKVFRFLKGDRHGVRPFHFTK
ncbi:glutamate receptor U1-like [Cylas formicarius]|uniref:glutamate receptor U1-like n=1 Tax=Cylas formicarius TaxID=197179 RepID=UPI002958C34A|nr:glutamate receptor U1-like [Cylas formicarius]